MRLQEFLLGAMHSSSSSSASGMRTSRQAYSLRARDTDPIGVMVRTAAEPSVLHLDWPSFVAVAASKMRAQGTDMGAGTWFRATLILLSAVSLGGALPNTAVATLQILVHAVLASTPLTQVRICRPLVKRCACVNGWGRVLDA